MGVSEESESSPDSYGRGIVGQVVDKTKLSTVVQEKDVGGIGYRKSDTFGKSVQDAHCAVDLNVGPDGGHTGGTCKNDARASVARIFKPALEDVMMNTLTEAEDRMVPAGIRPMKFQLNEKRLRNN